MLLTIGLLINNDEKFLRDCLNGIKPILDNVPSELIVLYDNGSKDNSVAIAKNFTNNVFEIEWRNDFAWARNQHLKRAKGEWFFKLDADEIFEDVQDIVDFFNSGEYKNYGTATIQFDDNPDVKNSKIFKHLRLFKMLDGMQWIDKMHERMFPYAEPTKHLQSICLHYGNIKEVLQEKGKNSRYLTLLQNIHNDEPTNYRNILALARFYFETDPKISLKYAELGINLAKQSELKLPYSPQYYPAFMQFLVELYLKFEDYQKINDCINEYFNSVQKSQISEAACHIKYIQSLALAKQAKFEDAKNAAILAYNFKKQLDNNELKPVYTFCIHINLNNSQFISLILESFVLANLLEDSINWIQQTIEQDSNVSKYECYAELINKICNHNVQMLGDFYVYFADKFDIIALIENKINAQANKIELANIILQKSVDETAYIKLQKIKISLDKTNKNHYNIDDYLAYFAQQEELSIIYADVLVAAIHKNKYITEISQKINMVDPIIIFDNPIKPVQFLHNIITALQDKLNTTENQLLFEMFANIFHQYCKMIYQADIYCENNINLLPTEHIVAFYLGTAYEYKQEKKTADFAKYLRLALKFAPQYKQYIQKITSDLLETHVEQPLQAQQQLKQETDRLKAIIYEMLNTGNLSQAQQIFETYAQINPADSDIPAMRKALFN